MSVGSDGVRVHTDTHCVVTDSQRVHSNEILMAVYSFWVSEDCVLVCFGVRHICIYFGYVGSDIDGVSHDMRLVVLDVTRHHSYLMLILSDLRRQCQDITEIARNAISVYVDSIQIRIDGILVIYDGTVVRWDIVLVLGDDPRVILGFKRDIVYIHRVGRDTVEVFKDFLWIDFDVVLVSNPDMSVGRDIQIVRTDVINVSIYLLLVWFYFI